MPSCRFRSTAGAAWKWICFARRSRIAIEFDGGQHLADADAYRRDRRKEFCCRRTAISCCGSSPKMSASISIKFSMPSCGLYHIRAPEPELRSPKILPSRPSPVALCAELADGWSVLARAFSR